MHSKQNRQQLRGYIILQDKSLSSKTPYVIKLQRKCGSFDCRFFHSHSTVLGGLDVMSYTTLLIPGTSATMRLLIFPSTS